uniref:Thiamine pyrophosphate-binding protein n=1 Tax=Thermomicrobium roseum TaxID=500 RepID=A0A7C5VVR0_THERO
MLFTGAELLVKALERHHVDLVFSIPGVHTLDIYAALERSSLRTILPRHEQGAGYMADGYARASGRVGVALTISGPGLTNILTPVAQAFADSVSLFVISTSLERHQLGQMHGELHAMPDQLAVIRPVVKWAYRVMSASEIEPAVAAAFDQLWNGRPRPVYLEVPLDVLREQAPSCDQYTARRQPRAPNPADVDRAVELLAAARRAVILAGGGAVAEEVSPLLAELASELRAPVFMTVTGKGAIPEDHPYAVGSWGYRWTSDNPAADLFRSSDVVLALGTGLGTRTTAGGTLPLPRTLIHVDIDPMEFSSSYCPTLAVAADVGKFVAALLERIRGNLRPSEGWDPETIAKTREFLRSFSQDTYDRYKSWVQALRSALPRETFTAHDMTMVCYAGVRYFPVYLPRTYTFPRGFGTLGSALPMAIGAKFARPERPAVAICGDGGIQFTIQELGTVAQYRLPVIVVVFDDHTHTAVKRAMQGREMQPRDVDLINPDFVALARAYEIESVRVTEPEELAQALSRAIERPTPTLVHVILRDEP